VADTGLRAGIGGAREAHTVLVEVRRLLRVADPELDVVPAEQRHEVFGHRTDSSAAYSRPAGTGSCAVAAAGRREIRSKAMPAKMSTPPAISSPSNDSLSRMSAKNTAKNGWRFPKSAARDAPTRSIAVNQRMF